LKQIAELLAEAGIASLRYDKRGIGASTVQDRTARFAELERFFSWDNFVGDVAAAHAELVKHDEIKAYATALLGPQRGRGLLVLAAAPTIIKNPPHGMVLVATPGRKLSDILRAQVGRGAPNLAGPTDHASPPSRRPGMCGRPAARARRALSALRRAVPAAPAGVRSCAGAFGIAPALPGAAGRRPDRQVVPMEDVQPLIDALASATRQARRWSSPPPATISSWRNGRPMPVSQDRSRLPPRPS
jgi:hypothetical protein